MVKLQCSSEAAARGQAARAGERDPGWPCPSCFARNPFVAGPPRPLMVASLRLALLAPPSRPCPFRRRAVGTCFGTGHSPGTRCSQPIAGTAAEIALAWRQVELGDPPRWTAVPVLQRADEPPALSAIGRPRGGQLHPTIHGRTVDAVVQTQPGTVRVRGIDLVADAGERTLSPSRHQPQPPRVWTPGTRACLRTKVSMDRTRQSSAVVFFDRCQPLPWPPTHMPRIILNRQAKCVGPCPAHSAKPLKVQRLPGPPPRKSPVWPKLCCSCRTKPF